MGKLVVIRIGEGNFELGFPVTLDIGEEGASFHTSLPGRLPDSLIDLLYEKWQSEYRKKVSGRMIAPPAQVANRSNSDLIESSNLLKQELNNWLNSKTFSPIKGKFQQKLKTDDTVRVIIQTENHRLRRLPWYLWDLFDSYRFAEVALSLSEVERVDKSVKPKPKVRILAILGDSSPDPRTGIRLNINADKQFWESLPDAETVFLGDEDEPSREKFNEQLWDENGWDILFFAGHSSSQSDATTGEMYINSKESLTIAELKYALQKAIERGLQLAIFNSCDGLGIARDLAELQIPQIIVMREPVPDAVAQNFLKYFLSSFSSGKSLSLAVREAREKLHGIENYFPCASWLPVICQNPAVEPITWNQLIGIDESSRRKATANVQNQLSRQEFKNRRALLAQVRTEVWGLLEQSLHHAVLINLHKENQPDLVKRSWDVEVKVGKTQSRESVNSNIIKIFDRESIAGKLLILGLPGAGKTTTQLELAQELIKRAENDANEPMPVLFNLSSWKDDNQTIAQWLIQELKDKYRFRKKIGEDWLKDHEILPILDGLDELASHRQKKCVQAINQFMESEESPLYIVVCCRSEEYELWKTPLNLNGAICLSPLTEAQIQQYLARVELSKLWKKIKDYPVILDLIKTPLFLSMMTLAYESLSIDEWGSYTTKETCREYLFKVYVERMLKRQIKNLWYPVSKQPNEKNIKYWLSWLSSKLEKNNQTEFLIENMQPCLFLAIKYQNILTWCELIISMILFIIILVYIVHISYPVFYKFFSDYHYIQGVTQGVAKGIGMLVVLLSYLWSIRKEYLPGGKFMPGGKFSGGSQEIKLVRGLKFPKKEDISAFAQKHRSYAEEIHGLFWDKWEEQQINEMKENLRSLRTFKKVINFLFIFLWIPFVALSIIYKFTQNVSVILESITGLIILTFIFYILIFILKLIEKWMVKIIDNFHNIRLFGSTAGSFIAGFLSAIQKSDTDTVTSPNEGIFQSLFISVIITFFTGLTTAIICTLILGIKWGISLGIVLGIFIGLGFGGRACIQHFVMRLILWFSGNIPWNYARFLNYATERMLLQRVGGRYRFIHRFLQEYFANIKLN
ncbi:CHAT domain-containing protein [Kamptonema sp. UHCC 0994]|uniref:CHAT domain-containing protein n=1 Tax=Kamptonema sp. UHCC 0994 TaxID=3031329 RepID=UPI0023B97AF2|nr:CHAT domain-containing protein [Kamptonema sp. UHCC 0994]MDF0555610.1 CHAT domain-containing protein [Kamptonema sp. UHCC 0994]